MLMARIKKKKSFWCENKDGNDANDKNDDRGGEHQHNNDINEQWEKEVQMMKRTNGIISSKVPWHGIISSFTIVIQLRNNNNNNNKKSMDRQPAL